MAAVLAADALGDCGVAELTLFESLARRVRSRRLARDMLDRPGVYTRPWWELEPGMTLEDAARMAGVYDPRAEQARAQSDRDPFAPFYAHVIDP